MNKFAVVVVMVITVVAIETCQGGSPTGRRPIGPLSPIHPLPGPRGTYINTPLYITGSTMPSKICYCFKRLCQVPGLSNGFKGWHVYRVSGYVAHNGYLYKMFQCRG